MRLILFNIFDKVTQLIDKAWGAHPENAIGYGLALVVLIIVCSVFYNNWKQELKYSRERDEKVLEFNNTVIQWMKKVEIRLEDQQSYSSKLEDIHDLANLTFKTAEFIKKLILKHWK